MKEIAERAFRLLQILPHSLEEVMTEPIAAKPEWCTGGCRPGAHVHMDIGDLELWEMPQGFYWSALKVGKKIRDTYYQGPSKTAAEEALLQAWAILQAARAPTPKGKAYRQGPPREPVPTVALEHERALAATYRVLSAWNAKLPAASKIKEAEMLFIADGILNNLRRLAQGKPFEFEAEPQERPAGGPSPMPTTPAKPEQSSSKELPDHVVKARERYPRAYEPWSRSEDEDLTEKHRDGASIDQLANTFKRQPGAIRSRLAKLGLTP